jgi:hypothetical protein
MEQEGRIGCFSPWFLCSNMRLQSCYMSKLKDEQQA